MKVKELIEKLDFFDKDADVKIEVLKDNFLMLEDKDILIYMPKDGSIPPFIGIKTWDEECFNES